MKFGTPLNLILLFGTIICLTSCVNFTPKSTNGLGNPAAKPSYQFVMHDNIWDSLRTEFNLPDETPANPEVRKQINWYMSHQKYLIGIAKHAKPYLYYIDQQVKKRHLPAELTLLPIIESNYDPISYSKVGAAGLWQIMPGTASGFGLKIDWWYDGRRDITASTNAALDYFSYLGSFFDNDWLLAIAAYNTGEGTVSHAAHYNAQHGKLTDFWHLTLSKETESYVPKLLALATIIKHPNEYPIKLPIIKNQPYLAQVNVGSQIDLKQAAKLAGISLVKLIELNPAYNRWATDPEGPHKLLLPMKDVSVFQKNLAHLPKAKRTTWRRYKVKHGDSLLRIANKFKTTATLLRHVNQLKGTIIRMGHNLLIPTKRENLAQAILRSEQHYLNSRHMIPEIKLTYHVVKRGETLEAITRQYHLKKTRAIVFWNGLKSVKDLKVGQKLIIWPPRIKYHAPTTKTVHHKVRRGDSLSKIAHKYHMTTTKLERQNHLRNSMIRVGQILTISFPFKYVRHKVHKKVVRYTHRIVYHIRRGDTLIHIAKRYHTTVAKLKLWNKIHNSKHIHPHQRIVMYR